MDKEKSVINFTKMRMIAGVFTEIQKYQQTRYRFVPIPQVADMIKNRRVNMVRCETVVHLQPHKIANVRVCVQDQNELYEKSFLAEVSTRQSTLTSSKDVNP